MNRPGAKPIPGSTLGRDIALAVMEAAAKEHEEVDRRRRAAWERRGKVYPFFE